jgi:hypothetical protein
VFVGRLLLLFVMPVMLFGGLITDYSQIPNPLLVSDFQQPYDSVNLCNCLFTAGPTEVGTGSFSVLFASTLPTDFTIPPPVGSVLGTTPYGLGQNGSWDSPFVFAALNVDAFGGDGYTMTFTLAHPVRAVGAYMNYIIPNAGDPSVGPVLITALDSSNNVLEQDRIDDGTNDITTPGGFNAGAWRGILLNSPDIAAIQFTNAGIILTNLTVGQEPETNTELPEPGSIAMAGLGLIFILHRKCC